MPGATRSTVLSHVSCMPGMFFSMDPELRMMLRFQYATFQSIISVRAALWNFVSHGMLSGVVFMPSAICRGTMSVRLTPFST